MMNRLKINWSDQGYYDGVNGYLYKGYSLTGQAKKDYEEGFKVGDISFCIHCGEGNRFESDTQGYRDE